MNLKVNDMASPKILTFILAGRQEKPNIAIWNIPAIFL